MNGYKHAEELRELIRDCRLQVLLGSVIEASASGYFHCLLVKLSLPGRLICLDPANTP
jgi:hypothetical protein